MANTILVNKVTSLSKKNEVHLSVSQIVTTLSICILICAVAYLIMGNMTFQYRWLAGDYHHTPVPFLTAVCEIGSYTDKHLIGFSANVLVLVIFALCYIGSQLIFTKKKTVTMIIVALMTLGVSFVCSYIVLDDYRKAVITIYDYEFWYMLLNTLWPLFLSFLSLLPSLVLCVALSILHFKGFKKSIIFNLCVVIIDIALIVFAYWAQF